MSLLKTTKLTICCLLSRRLIEFCRRKVVGGTWATHGLPDSRYLVDKSFMLKDLTYPHQNLGRRDGHTTFKFHKHYTIGSSRDYWDTMKFVKTDRHQARVTNLPPDASHGINNHCSFNSAVKLHRLLPVAQSHRALFFHHPTY